MFTAITTSISWAGGLALAALAVSLVLVFVRLVRGPGLPDRVVAMDMISYLAIGIIAVFALLLRQPAYLDAALILALVAFLATVAFGRHVERTEHGLHTSANPPTP